MTPGISVIIPLYNSERYLQQAIDSIITQTYTDWELIAVCEPDSSDNTNEIIREYSERYDRIKPIFNTDNIGISASLNVGIRASKGEYIARMDGDDICHTRRFEKQAEFLEAHPDVSILGSNIQIIDTKGKAGGHISKYALHHEQIKSDLLFYCELMHPAVMMRKADIEKHHLCYDDNYRASEDFELWNRASRVVKLANLPEILLYYRWGLSTSTRKNTEIGDKNYIAVIDRSCRELMLEFSQDELQLLYPRTCNMKLSNLGYVRQTLEYAAKRIVLANNNCGIYQPEALSKTLDKRLYWKQHPIRGITAAVTRSICRDGNLANGLAGYLEQRGFIMAMRRCFSFLFSR